MAVDAHETMGGGATTQVPTPMKFSRYRSVRRAASQKLDSPKAAIPTVPIPPVPGSGSQRNTESASQETMVARSMSRYRRQRNPGSSTASQPPVPTSVQSNHVPRVQHDNADDEDEAARARHREEAMNRLVGGDSPVKSQTRETTTNSKSRKNPDQKNHDNPTEQNEVHLNEKVINRTKLRSLKDTMKISRSKGEAKDEGTPVKLVETSAAVFPGVDAPVSAVNAGERRVLVQYRKLSNYLPVTPTTRVQDLLYLAQDHFTREIDPQKFIVIETFSQLGLERPLRKYENVRDVMNSWTNDERNALIIVPAASLDNWHQLEIQSAPIGQPADTTFHIYHSQQARKWDKRFVTLRADGQVTVSKKHQAQDQTNICHLSDFEVYSPTSSSLSNDMRPPKKICYSVKSQRKASMFLSTENYVHFFSTNDKAIAENLYKAISAWRSWYLVGVLGAGQKENAKGSLPEASRQLTDESGSQPKSSKPLLDLVDQHKDGQALPSIERRKSSKTRQLFSRKKGSPPPPFDPNSLTIDTTMADSTSHGTEDSPFSPTGLLGQTYIMRQRAMQEQEDEKKAFEPFCPQGLVSGASARRPSVGARSQPSSRSNTMTAAQFPDVSGLVKRSQSMGKSNHKPLVDLTPIYQEPPQHIRKGRGVAVEPGTPLVGAATGPELSVGAIAIPPATTWKRPTIPEEPSPSTSTSTSNNAQTRSRSNTARSGRYYRSNYTTSASPISPPDHAKSPDNPFMSNSLLARSTDLNNVQNVLTTGHRLVTGDRNATKPMLDLSPANPFVEGSLLRDL